jgi:disulfide oxidoreductase YuzD
MTIIEYYSSKDDYEFLKWLDKMKMIIAEHKNRSLDYINNENTNKEQKDSNQIENIKTNNKISKLYTIEEKDECISDNSDNIDKNVYNFLKNERMSEKKSNNNLMENYDINNNIIKTNNLNNDDNIEK